MNILVILCKRLVSMFLFMFIGAILYKKKYISEEGSKSLGNLLIRMSLPCVILKAFQVERTPERLQALMLSIGFSILLLAAAILISRIFFANDPISHFAASFSNPGFFGIPLICAVLNDDAVFYVAPFIACLNILQWTYGVAVLTEKKVKIEWKNIIFSPFMFAFLLGVIIFLVQVNMPEILNVVIDNSANMNTPLAMLVSGVYMAKVNFRVMLTSGRLYAVSVVRLIVNAVVAGVILSFLPQSWYPLKICLFIAAACPVGSNVAVYAQLHGKDYVYAVETVVLSTIISVITLPLTVYIIQYVWG